VKPDRNSATAYSGSLSNGGNSSSETKATCMVDEGYGTDEEVGSGTIQLDACNTVVGKLQCGMKFDIVVDSGASMTLISSDVVQASKYLRSLPQVKTEPIRIRIADGSYMVCDRRIDFSVLVQGFTFDLCAQVMPSFGLVKALLGSADLKRLSAQLDFKTNKLSFKLILPRSVPFEVKNAVVLKPGESKFIEISGKLAKNCSSGDLVLNASKLGRKFTSSCFLTKVKKGTCLVALHNSTDKTVKLNRGAVLAYADLEASHRGRHSIDEESFSFHSGSVEDEFRSKLLKKNLRKYPFLEKSDPKARMSEQEILNSEVDLDSNCVLSSDQKSRLNSLLQKHKKAFSIYGEIGNTQHVIKLHLVDETPFFIRPYTVSVASCSSPVMLIGKKGTTAKRCVSDFRFLNQRIRRQNWPFPLVKDTIQKLGMSECSVVSTVDLKEAFHSLHLDEKSQQFTGIVSYYGGRSYFYKRLPMGSSVSPSEWQFYIERLLDDIPGSREFCIAHMDDLIVFSKSVPEHMKHLDQLLGGILKHGLKISPKKAKFCKTSVEYMGHVISVDEKGPCIAAMKSKCEAIKGLRVPTNSKEVRMFIGAVSLHSQPAVSSSSTS
jgi:hypothetical protein